MMLEGRGRGIRCILSLSILLGRIGNCKFVAVFPLTKNRLETETCLNLRETARGMLCLGLKGRATYCGRRSRGYCIKGTHSVPYESDTTSRRYQVVALSNRWPISYETETDRRIPRVRALLREISPGICAVGPFNLIRFSSRVPGLLLLEGGAGMSDSGAGGADGVGGAPSNFRAPLCKPPPFAGGSGSETGGITWAFGETVVSERMKGRDLR